MSASLDDVATLAKVSKSTVSRYLNDGYVSSDKRERIRAAIESLGYVANRNARLLRSNKLNSIALFVPTVEHPFFSCLADRVEKFLYERGVRMVLVSSAGNIEKEKEMIDMVGEKMVSGCIVVTHNLIPNLPENAPIVTIDRHFGPTIPCITSDNYEASLRALEYLYESGCRHIGFIGGRPLVPSEVNDRLGAYLDFCAKHHLVPTYSYQTFDHGQEYEIAKAFLRENPNLDSTFCGSDLLAYSVYQLTPKSLIPAKFKIISFDGITEKLFSYVRLTAVAQDVTALAKQAVEVLLDRIAGKPTKEKYIIPTRFTLGETA